MYAYFIDISQGSVEMHLLCGGIYNNHIITNCLQSVPVTEFWRSIIGEDMDKSKVACFLAHSVFMLSYVQQHCGLIKLGEGQEIAIFQLQLQIYNGGNMGDQ